MVESCGEWIINTSHMYTSYDLFRPISLQEQPIKIHVNYQELNNLYFQGDIKKTFDISRHYSLLPVALGNKAKFITRFPQ